VKIPRRLRREDGQGVIEFAIIAIVLLNLFLGTVDYARFIYYDNAIRDAARVGAETAINRCPNHYACSLSAPTTSNFIFQNTVCNAQPYVQLTPAVTTCTPCRVGSAGCADPCPPSGLSPCADCGSQQDVCISGSHTTGQTITVSVGYHFKPISPLMSVFFQDTTCFSGDDSTFNHHDLCASSSGRVS
jgi:Flp pilus assembly protein TadG